MAIKSDLLRDNADTFMPIFSVNAIRFSEPI